MKKKIAIVDDLENNLSFFKELLSQFDVDADFFLSANSALDAIKQNNYDIVFLDMEMPEMNGAEMAVYIKAWQIQTKRNFPVCALTGHDKSDYPGLLEHFDDFISRFEFENWLKRHI